MKRINKKLLEALDKLIAKYSGEELEYIHSHMNCPLCDLFYISTFNRKKHNDCCKGCPNMYFAIKKENQEYIAGCDDRNIQYPKLSYLNKRNHTILKQFWTDYKSFYLQRIYSNSEIMEILIKPFKEEKK